MWQKLSQEPTIEGNPPADQGLIPHILSGSFYFGGSSTLLVSRASHDDVGGWDERFERHQDWQYVIDLIRNGYRLKRTQEKLVKKHDTSPPSGEDVEAASARLLSKYEDLVRAAEQEGFDVRGFHLASIAESYFREGDFATGLRRLKELKGLTIKRTAHLVYAVWQGIRRRLCHW
jgi:hypothetical protein